MRCKLLQDFFNRRGIASCLITVALIGACMIGGFYFLLRTSEEEKGPSRKPIIKSFAHDISGSWYARLVKINPPPRSRPDYKPSWMRSDFREFDAQIEIGRDFHLKRAKWVEISTNSNNQVYEWFSHEKWKQVTREMKPGHIDSCGEAERDKKMLKVKYSGDAYRTVREYSFEFNDMPPVPANTFRDGGFRETDSKGEIEAEAVFYAPKLFGKNLDKNKFRIEVTPFGFGLANNDFAILGGRPPSDIEKLLRGHQKVSFELLKKFQITKIRGGDLRDLDLRAYPGGGKLDIEKCNCQFWFDQNGREGDRAFVEIDPVQTKVVLTKTFDQSKKIRVVFAPDGSGRLFTHDNIMEYKLSREP